MNYMAFQAKLRDSELETYIALTSTIIVLTVIARNTFRFVLRLRMRKSEVEGNNQTYQNSGSGD